MDKLTAANDPDQVVKSANKWLAEEEQDEGRVYYTCARGKEKGLVLNLNLPGVGYHMEIPADGWPIELLCDRAMALLKQYQAVYDKGCLDGGRQSRSRVSSFYIPGPDSYEP